MQKNGIYYCNKNFYYLEATGKRVVALRDPWTLEMHAMDLGIWLERTKLQIPWAVNATRLQDAWAVNGLLDDDATATIRRDILASLPKPPQVNASRETPSRAPLEKHPGPKQKRQTPRDKTRLIER